MEKRRHKRIDLDIPVTIRCQGNLLPANAINISYGGICLITDDVDINMDSKVEIGFDLGDKKDISLCGVVTRVDTEPLKKVGVQFNNYFSPGHKEIRNFLANNQ